VPPESYHGRLATKAFRRVGRHPAPARTPFPAWEAAVYEDRRTLYRLGECCYAQWRGSRPQCLAPAHGGREDGQSRPTPALLTGQPGSKSARAGAVPGNVPLTQQALAAHRGTEPFKHTNRHQRIHRLERHCCCWRRERRPLARSFGGTSRAKPRVLTRWKLSEVRKSLYPRSGLQDRDGRSGESSLSNPGGTGPTARPGPSPPLQRSNQGARSFRDVYCPRHPARVCRQEPVIDIGISGGRLSLR